MPDLLLGQALAGTKATLVLEYPLISVSVPSHSYREHTVQVTEIQVLFPSSHIS